MAYWKSNGTEEHQHELLHVERGQDGKVSQCICNLQKKQKLKHTRTIYSKFETKQESNLHKNERLYND